MTPTEQPKQPKRPLSEAPRFGTKLSQKGLQVKGVFTQCDPHPIYEGVFYWSFEGNQQRWSTEESWSIRGISTPEEVLEKRRAACEYNLNKAEDVPRVYEEGSQLGLIDQQSMQVTGEFTQGDAHPRYSNYIYFSTRKKRGQVWMTVEDFDKLTEQQQERVQSPEGQAMRAATNAKRRKTLNNNIKLPKDVLDELRDVYHTRDALTLAARAAGSSEEFHVDHIYPLRPAPINFNGSLQRPYVGLHAPWNLQIIEKSENLSKSNTTPEQS